jgi:hypothetical protein
VAKALTQARHNKTRAAKLLGLTRAQLYSRIEKYAWRSLNPSGVVGLMAHYSQTSFRGAIWRRDSGAPDRASKGTHH